MSHSDIITLGRESKGILEICDRITEAARQHLKDVGDKDFGSRSPASAHLRDSDIYQALRCVRTPIVARLGTKDELNRTRVYYVCPCEPPPGCRRSMLVNVFSPFGRIMALKPGDIFETPEGERLAVIDKTSLYPEDYLHQKDIFEALFEYRGQYKVRLKSLREVCDRINEPRYSLKHLVPSDDPAGDTILVLEGEENDEIEVEIDEETEIISAAPLVRLAERGLVLADLPHLDLQQDQICRRPLDSRLLIMGLPGTGKTSTLIKRLDFKITRQYLAGEELAIVDQLEASGQNSHAVSWHLFTPTDILRRYVLETFRRTLIPGYDDNISSWQDYRKNLARNLFGLLQTPDGGKFILSSNLNYLSQEAKAHTDRWFDEFNNYQWQRFVRQLQIHSARLASSGDTSLAALGRRACDALEQSQTGALARLLLAMEPMVPTISGYNSILSQSVKESTSQLIESISQTDPDFLSYMADFYDTLPRTADSAPAGSAEAFNEGYTFMARVLREKAQALAYGQPYQSDNRKMLFWQFLSGRLDEKTLLPMGHSCLALLSLRKLNCSSQAFTDAYFEAMADSYLAFRKSGPVWYTKAGIENTYLNELELDLLLLAVMESSSALLWQDYLKPGRLPLGPILKAHKEELRSQILVDEAADFSPVQLRCLMNLTHPSCSAFYAAADLNQRFTLWGAKSLTDFEWAVPGLSEVTLSANYRASKPLDELARGLAVKSGSRYSERSEQASSLELKPILLTGCPDEAAGIEWLRDRLAEIKGLTGKMPSAAVVINSETDLGRLAQGLTEALEPIGLPAAAVFRESEEPAEDSPVRCFNLKHIKGLEFEAVFLLNVDQLVQSQPDLYRQLIYTAVSRAASFFGATCRGAWPEELAYLEPLFGQDWS
ncbi:MAG: ATP-binding domain-containing protein [Deltaproteobacteria bacterium]|nr:ATP-binding domain-containing protein [Deltaproteobacteria bacterium]